MKQYNFTAKEQAVLDAYSESLDKNSIYDAHMVYARKLISVTEPDVIIMFSTEELYDLIVREGYEHVPARVSKGRSKALFHIRYFHSFLNSVFDAGKHLDDWFEPECRY